MVRHKYSEEERAFLREFVPGHSHKEITEEFNRNFSANITVTQIASSIKRYNLNTGRTGRFEKGHEPANKGTHPKSVGRMIETQFKKGNLPHNTKPMGYERITRDGYIEVKVSERPNRKTGERNFIPKHRLIWEQINGPIPKGYIVIFLDGNSLNCVIENLALISRAEHLQMTRKGLRSEIPQFTETGVLIARASVIANEKNKRKKEK